MRRRGSGPPAAGHRWRPFGRKALDRLDRFGQSRALMLYRSIWVRRGMFVATAALGALALSLVPALYFLAGSKTPISMVFKAVWVLLGRFG